MNPGNSTIIYPVRDYAKVKKLYNNFFGTAPLMDEANYVEYKVGNQDIGLDPNSTIQGMTGPVGYYQVSDIKKSLQGLLDDGAQKMQDIKDVGGGKLIASVKDRDGNLIGLIQMP